MAAEAFYPPAPAAVPAEITHIDSRYSACAWRP